MKYPMKEFMKFPMKKFTCRESGAGWLDIDEEKLKENYLKLLDFVKKMAEHFNLWETQKDFIDFYVIKERSACELLEEIGKTDE